MEEVLRKLARGEISVEEAVRTLKLFAIEKIGEFARIDVGRELRRGIPEIILAEGKSLEELSEIVFRSIETAGRVIVSRLDGGIMDELAEKARRRGLNVEEYREARMLVVRKTLGRRETGGRVGVITAGTADIPVAEEASIIAKEMGCKVYKVYDVGVAGLHRVFDAVKTMVEADVDVIIVAAGREGALPSIVASLVDIPVIGVPTSQGYGFGGSGVAALQSMLQSCPLGLTVVNIDAGVAAGAVAALIANRAAYRAGVK
ncbi:nickel pincer cofactor biosynthesis protein LarB [Candidatus Bathyarchaeota archaeon]|nr:MAG: nickel pincer cofactor biosynthesis protein LarB [Candidatus Bathyarchaeota archaeon]